MYRSNQHHGISPRDCLDPRLLERIALRSEMPSDISEPCACQRVEENGSCGCGTRSVRNENVRMNRRSDCCENGNRRNERESDGCDCDNYNAEFDYTLAFVYPPKQEWQNLYCEEEGFSAGTIFRELDKPFFGPKCRGGNMYE